MKNDGGLMLEYSEVLVQYFEVQILSNISEEPFCLLSLSLLIDDENAISASNDIN